MTPTREQVIEWAKRVGFDLYDMKESPRSAIDKAERLAALAYSAGRLKGLEEAKEVCATERAEFIEQSARNDGRHSDMAFGGVNSADRIAAAIDQLKEQK